MSSSQDSFRTISTPTDQALRPTDSIPPPLPLAFRGRRPNVDSPAYIRRTKTLCAYIRDYHLSRCCQPPDLTSLSPENSHMTSASNVQQNFSFSEPMQDGTSNPSDAQLAPVSHSEAPPPTGISPDDTSGACEYTNSGQPQQFILSKEALDHLVSSLVSNAIQSTASVLFSLAHQPVSAPLDSHRLTTYRKDLQSKFDSSSIYMFNGSNFVTWRTNVFTNAHVTNAVEILSNHQHTVPSNLSPFDAECWKIRNSLLHTRIFQSLTSPVRQTLGLHLDDHSACVLFQQLTSEYGVALAWERLSVLRELIGLRVEH